MRGGDYATFACKSRSCSSFAGVFMSLALVGLWLYPPRHVNNERCWRKKGGREEGSRGIRKCGRLTVYEDTKLLSVLRVVVAILVSMLMLVFVAMMVFF